MSTRQPLLGQRAKTLTPKVQFHATTGFFLTYEVQVKAFKRRKKIHWLATLLETLLSMVIHAFFPIKTQLCGKSTMHKRLRLLLKT